MWVLTVRSPNSKPREFTISKPETTIGRRWDNDIAITDISASRVHALIQYDESSDRVMLRDLGSTNGTYLNRERLGAPQLLKHNDLIRIGEHTIKVTQVQTGEPVKVLPPGSQILTRDVVLESIDENAVLLYDIAQKLNTVLDVSTVLHEVSKMMRRTLGADRCDVILKDDFEKLSELGFPTTIAKMVIKNRSAIVISDLQGAREKYGKSAWLQRVRSAICVPIISAGDLLGLIYMYKNRPESAPFDRQDFKLAVAISHQAALALQRMNLMDLVREEKRIRELFERFVSPVEAKFVSQRFIQSGVLPDLEEIYVTILFVDIADSTGLAERLGPGKFGELLRNYYQAVTEFVFSNGGVVDKFMGDGVMAVFGLSGERPEPVSRAIKSGIKILTILQELSITFQEEIKVGIGINTGPVVAGYIRTKQQVELVVLGDTVNVAAGLQHMARPNRIFVGPATVAAVVGEFSTRRVGGLRVKGRSKVIQAHEVLVSETAGA